MRAGFSEISSERQASSTICAPCKNSSIGIPARLAKTRPTWENTLNRPPMPSGTVKQGKCSFSARGRILPFSLSVMAMRWISQTGSSSFCNPRTAVTGSMVVPDLEITRKSTFIRRSAIRPASPLIQEARSVKLTGSTFWPEK